MKRNYNLDEVIGSLMRKHDCRVDRRALSIRVLNGRSAVRPVRDLGNGSWGKIDYLCRYEGYRMEWD